MSEKISLDSSDLLSYKFVYLSFSGTITDAIIRPVQLLAQAIAKLRTFAGTDASFPFTYLPIRAAFKRMYAL